MIIKKAEYILSSPDLIHCPEPDVPEYAFIGRSNVGKSSLINMITGHKKLAKTSGKPGKTRMINFFNINDEWRIVDLPGYGYASVSKSTRLDWQKMIGNYLLKRDNLYCVFNLIDSRIPIQKIDIEFINWLGEKNIPFVIVFTKTEKTSGNTIKKNISDLIKILTPNWDDIPQIFMTSAISAEGKEDILKFIDSINKSN